MDDMQAKAGIALFAPCREERIECLTPDIEAHTATIVGKKDINSVVTRGLDLDVDGPVLAVKKRMRDRIKEEVS